MLKQAQYVLGLSGFGRQHIPHLQILLKPIYTVIYKSAHLAWSPLQQKALESVQITIGTPTSTTLLFTSPRLPHLKALETFMFPGISGPPILAINSPMDCGARNCHPQHHATYH